MKMVYCCTERERKIKTLLISAIKKIVLFEYDPFFSFLNKARFVSQQICDKSDIQSSGLHTFGKFHVRTRKSYYEDDPYRLGTWSKKMNTI